MPPQEAATNGYAFFVIGEHPNLRPPYIPPLPKLDYGFPGLSDLIPIIVPGGLRLRRPMGMYEQAVAYDWNSSYGYAYSGPLWAANDPEQRFVYVGREHYHGSLSRIGNYDSTNTWVFPKTWTPGLPNVGQTVPFAEVIIPGITNMMVFSAMNMDQATQNGQRTTYYALKLRRGSWSNIVYAADDWYRITSVKMNAIEQLAPDSALRSYTLALGDIQTNINVLVTIRLRQDIAGLDQDPVVFSWLLGFEDAPLITSAYGGRELMLTDLYWLNADPTMSNRLEYTVTRLNVDSAGNVHAAVRLSLNGQNVMNLQGPSVMKLEVKNRLADPEWHLLGQYALGNASFDTNHTSRFTIPNPFLYMLRGWDRESLYCRVKIEMEDPRLLVFELVTEPGQ